jgi:hypothetical protein
MRRVLAAAAPLAGLLVFVGLALGARKDHIRSAHDIHADNNVTCDVCHEGAAASRAGSDNLLPTHEACAVCHDVEAKETCEQCHSDPEKPLESPRVTTMARKFPHETHVALGMECSTCHAMKNGEALLPKKASCRTCHATASGGSDCMVCHATGETMRPASHTPGWVSFHGVEARVNQAACADCHTQTECQDCHAGDNVRPRVHPLNFEFDHALAARGNEATCSTCHEDRSFCSSCHATQNVLPENHSRVDWVLASGGRHAEEGLFDLESCVACHEAGTGAPTCAPCHGE